MDAIPDRRRPPTSWIRGTTCVRVFDRATSRFKYAPQSLHMTPTVSRRPKGTFMFFLQAKAEQIKHFSFGK
jgi:hypothetical protein